MDINKLREEMTKTLDCGHTAEEHLAAAIIVLACKQVNMPIDMMHRACQIIADKSHEMDVQVSKPEILAPMGNA